MIDDRNLYDRGYFADHYLTPNPKRDAAMHLERERLRGLVTTGATVLDVGCGLGKFLSLFNPKHWDRFGIDPSPVASKYAAERGITMVEKIEWLGVETFDLVIYRGTLQHIWNPMDSLVNATRILRPGGVLAILATPDTDSLVYQIWGELPALERPRNWVLFGHRYLRNILERLGYQDIRISHPYWSTPYARPGSDIIKFMVSLVAGWRPFAFPGNMMEITAFKK